MIKIVVLDGYSTNPGDLDWGIISRFGEVDIYDRTSEDELVSRSEGAKILLTNKTKITEAHLNALTDLELICVMATGFDVVDVNAARVNNIKVANVKGYSTQSVVQHTFSLILELFNNVGHHNGLVRNSKWHESMDFSFWDRTIYELDGKSLGIVGFGNIGRSVAKVGMAFGMNILAHHKYPNRDKMEGVEFLPLDDLFSQSDVVTLHCPLTTENRGMVNSDLLSTMKSGSVLINTARGGLVDLNALENVLINKGIAGAALDVLEEEPPIQFSPIFQDPNCIITPHQAWASIESRKRLLKGLSDNIEGFLEGSPINIVN